MYKMNSLWLFLIVSFSVFSEAFFIFLFVYKIGGMLICVFHCCNKFCLHNFIAMLVKYGSNFPICPSRLIHSIHLVCYFTWDKVPIPISWILTSWRDQSGCHDFGEINVLSPPISSKHSISRPFDCIVSLGSYLLEQFFKILILWYLFKLLFYLLKLFFPRSHPENQCF